MERRTNEADRRAERLKLTQHGKDMVKRMRPLVIATQAKILDGLTEEEKEQFTVLADKITQLHNDQSRAPLVLPKKNENA